MFGSNLQSKAGVPQQAAPQQPQAADPLQAINAKLDQILELLQGSQPEQVEQAGGEF